MKRSSFDKSFSDLVARLLADDCDAVTRAEAVSAIEEIIGDRNDEYRRAEEWRERFQICSANLQDKDRQARIDNEKTIKKLRLKVSAAKRDADYFERRFAELSESFAEASLEADRRLDAVTIDLLDASLALHLKEGEE